jgi:hypothetical protein
VRTIREDGLLVRAGLPELGLREALCRPQIGPTEICAHGGGFVETGTTEIRTFQVGTVHTSVLKIGVARRSFPK